jgi:predicted Zn finger-like uncharacterized protein
VKKVTTTCPSCKTSFRVTPQQLAARQGQVRCGHCNTLFNGLETLAMADQQASAKSDRVETVAQIPATPSPVRVARPVVRDKQFRPSAPPASATDDSDAPVLYRPDFRPPPAANRKLWLVGSALMLFLLLIQGATYFRNSLARDMPSMKPLLTTYCNMVGCELTLPRNADAITIESSDLKQFPDRPKEILLTALLRNRADYAQAYPSLELTLTDTADEPVVKRIFHPADYVEDKAAIAQGIAPLQEANVRLRLELIDLAAIGYRLFVYYP